MIITLTSPQAFYDTEGVANGNVSITVPRPHRQRLLVVSEVTVVRGTTWFHIGIEKDDVLVKELTTVVGHELNTLTHFLAYEEVIEPAAEDLVFTSTLIKNQRFNPNMASASNRLTVLAVPVP